MLQTIKRFRIVSSSRMVNKNVGVFITISNKFHYPFVIFTCAFVPILLFLLCQFIYVLKSLNKISLNQQKVGIWPNHFCSLSLIVYIIGSGQVNDLLGGNKTLPPP